MASTPNIAESSQDLIIRDAIPDQTALAESRDGSLNNRLGSAGSKQDLFEEQIPSFGQVGGQGSGILKRHFDESSSDR